MNPRYFNRFASDDSFKKIVTKTADELANGIKKSLEELEVDHDPSHAEQRPHTNVDLSQSLIYLIITGMISNVTCF